MHDASHTPTREMELEEEISLLEEKIRAMVPFISHLKHYEMCRNHCACHECINCRADEVWVKHNLDYYEAEE